MAANLGPGSLLRGGRFRLPADPLISGADEVDQAGDGVEVEGVTGHDDDVVGAGLDVLLPCLHLVGLDGDGALDGPGIAAHRSEARRVGKARVSTCRFWWSPVT